MTEEIYFRGVHNVTEFTRNELFVSFRQGGYQLSEASFYKKVEDMVNDGEIVRVGRDRKSTRLNSSHWNKSRMPSSA